MDRLDVDDGVDDVAETGESMEPVVSILPVPDRGEEGDEEILQDVSNAILGRGKDEVMEALGRAEPNEDAGEEKSASGEAKVVHNEL